jgi:biopolymer transport protein ExbB/TolQ
MASTGVPNRWVIAALFLLLGIASIAFLTLVLTGRTAELILDYPSRHFLYPFTIQNVMHLLFFFALGDLFVRWRAGAVESRYTRLALLPEDDATVLQSHDLGSIRRRVAPLLRKRGAFLPSLINLAILQFQSSRSVDQTTAIVNSSLELIAHRVDLAYNLVRFLAWMVPTLGFIGTVYGLGASLSEAGDPSKSLDLQAVSRTLGVGFDTTMVALVESAILVFMIHLTQEMEESAVNEAGEYTLRNLINRLYAAPGSSR